MTRTLLPLATAALMLAASGCKQPTQTRYLPDSALPQPDTGPDDLCDVSVVETRPVPEAVGVYYRDPLRVTFDDAAYGSTIGLTTAAGGYVPIQTSWDDSFNNATIQPLNPLDSNTAYVLSVQTCEDNAVGETPFTTSTFGAPLEINPYEMEGWAFHLPLGEANYEEPGGLGAIIANYLDQPLLIGVLDASVDTLTMMGAQGSVDGTTGAILQHNTRETWFFGVADFRARPYFTAYASAVPLTYESTEIVFYNFNLEGTFAADGSAIGGSRVTGQIDTRNLGPLLQIGSEPTAACEYVSGVGLECLPCPDGEPVCLNLRATFPTARVVEGLQLVPR